MSSKQILATILVDLATIDVFHESNNGVSRTFINVFEVTKFERAFDSKAKLPNLCIQYLFGSPLVDDLQSFVQRLVGDLGSDATPLQSISAWTCSPEDGVRKATGGDFKAVMQAESAKTSCVLGCSPETWPVWTRWDC